MTIGVIVHKIFKDKNGFTLMEIVAVIVVIGILAAVAITRSVNYDTEVYTGADVLKSHLRYAQIMAMNSSSTAADVPVIWGISSNGSTYWLFRGTNPADAAGYILLPEEASFINANRTINLTTKKIKFVPGFTIYFDNRGVPYSAYVSETNNTPLAATITINVQPLSAAAPKIPVTITPLTGYIP